ncbi:plasmid SOS inhibition protein A [Raoultella scottii]|uniref:plasmid SOS inhibition protein A n=1 Tax=Raoultella scottii TaxID=3040937 RepID=UPI003D16EAF2
MGGHRELCPLPLSSDVQTGLFPEIQHTRTDPVNTWYRRWADEFNAVAPGPVFWRGQTRFSSLDVPAWLHYRREGFTCTSMQSL